MQTIVKSHKQMKISWTNASEHHKRPQKKGVSHIPFPNLVCDVIMKRLQREFLRTPINSYPDLAKLRRRSLLLRNFSINLMFPGILVCDMNEIGEHPFSVDMSHEM